MRHQINGVGRLACILDKIDHSQQNCAVDIHSFKIAHRDLGAAKEGFSKFERWLEIQETRFSEFEVQVALDLRSNNQPGTIDCINGHSILGHFVVGECFERD